LLLAASCHEGRAPERLAAEYAAAPKDHWDDLSRASQRAHPRPRIDKQLRRRVRRNHCTNVAAVDDWRPRRTNGNGRDSCGVTLCPRPHQGDTRERQKMEHAAVVLDISCYEVVIRLDNHTSQWGTKSFSRARPRSGQAPPRAICIGS